MAITQAQARAELARRELARREQRPGYSSGNNDLVGDSIRQSYPRDTPQQEEAPESWGQQAYRLAIRDPMIGVANLGRGLANTPHKVADLFGYGDRVAELAPSDFDYAQAFGQNKSTTADKVMQFAPELAAAFALPVGNLGLAGEAIGSIPRVSSFLAKSGALPGAARLTGEVASQVAPQAAFAFTQDENRPGEAAAQAGGIMAPFAAASHLAQSGSPGLRLAAKGAGGLFGGYLGHKAGEQTGIGEPASYGLGAIGAALAARLMHGKGGAVSDSLSGITPRMLEDVQPKIEAMRRIGHQYQTPAELFGDPYLAARQGTASKTQGGGRLMQERGEERLSNEEDILNRFMNNISSPKDEALIDSLYSSAGRTKLSSKLIDKFMDNPVVQRAVNTVERAPEFQQELAGVSKNSVEYWNQVKRALDNVESKYTTSGDKVKARAVTKTRKALTGALDEASPIYEKARNAAELKITKEGVEKIFNKKQMSGTTMYDFMKDKSKYEKLYKSLRNAPGAQQNLKDMRLLFKDLINPSSVRTAAQLEKTSMIKPRSGGQFAEELASRFIKTRQGDEAVADMLTSNKWMDEVRRLNAITDKKKKAAEAIKLFGRGVSQSLANQ